MRIRSRVVLPASDTAAPLNIPHGIVPAAPVNGDAWTTTSGLYLRVNGATVGPFTATPLASTTPADVTVSAAAIGAATTAARADHKHNVATAAAISLSATTTNAVGSSTSLARSDHTHAIGTAAPAVNLSVSSTNSVGTATTMARSDHGHAVTFPGSVNGMLNITATSVTADATWTNLTNGSPSLAPGTYLLIAQVRVSCVVSAGSGYMSARFYNSTAGTELQVGLAAPPTSGGGQFTCTIACVVTLGVTSVIRLQAKRESIGATWTQSNVTSDANGWTSLTYVRLS